MRMVRRLAIALLSGLVLFLITIVMVVYSLGQLSVPPQAEEIELEGLSAPIAITFDGNGIPTIQAVTMLDAYQALGYLHARDRLWQMEAMRRIGSGRMAEVAGSPALPFDILMRELNLRTRAEQQVRNASYALREALEAYSMGVNAFMEKRSRPLPFEFQVLLHEPEPWNAADSLIWGQLMSLQLSGDGFQEADRATLATLLNPQALAEFRPDNEKTPTTLNIGNREAWITQYDASNAWVLDGSKTQTGAPILANDPHLGLGLPGQWYLARIETPTLTLVGATTPGVPLHILGHNGTIAWGLTTTHADTQDTVLLTPDLRDGAEKRVEQIAVRFGADISHTVLETPFGPYVTRMGGVLSWTGAATDIRTPDSLYRLNRAQNWEAFLEATASFDDPVQNVFYADTEGHIGMKVVGRLPIRETGQTGRVPRDPQSSAKWTGLVLSKDLPGILNPKDGIVANANNRIIDETYPYTISNKYVAGFRAERMLAVLADSLKDGHSLSDSTTLQNDTTSMAAAAIVPFLLRAEPATALGRKAKEILASWDFRMDRDLAAPTLYSTTLGRMIESVAVDDLGREGLAEFGRPDAAFLASVLTQFPHWCDDSRTPVTEDCTWAAKAALDRAAKDLSDAYGDDPAAWLWGTAHTAPMQNQPLGFLPLLGQFLNRPVPTSGGDHTVNRGQSRTSLDSVTFAHRHGAGFRAVYDLSDLDNSHFSLAGGQSGNPFSPHYGSLVEDWRDGRYFKIPGRDDDSQVTERLVLTPK